MQTDTTAGRRRGAGGLGLGLAASYALALALTATTRGLSPNRPGKVARDGQDKSSAASPSAADAGRGRHAQSPTEIPALGWWDIAKRLFEEIGKDRILAVAAGVTFYGLLAVFPAIAALVSLYGLVADPATLGEHIAALGGLLPGGAIDIISEQVTRITSKGDTALGFAFFFGLAVSLWSANAGMKAVFDALNVAYDEEEKRNFFWLNVWSLLFTFATVIFVTMAIGAVVVIPIVLKFVGLGPATEWIIWLGRWPILLVATLAALALLYRYGPSRERAQWRWLTPGAILAAVGGIVTSMLFSWYVSSFGSYNETYGSLGAVVGLMTWMWLTSTVVLVGAELNAETEHQTVKDSTEGGDKPIGARGARMADTVGSVRS
ncbi:YihY/virulence factor BrkB family protein [uncultured Enterovirga sp.]|uniref:YihY/virulence factor BrkB family protein n=1 Tax=uncultured Enterovirga sp. TaxID=2026352 RepID=UPI0035CAF57C